MIRDVAIPMADPRANRMVMVTSFNEWYEDTQIEATKGDSGVTNKDDSPSGQHFTEAGSYADYGELYLDILREETLAPNESPATEIESMSKILSFNTKGESR